MAGGCEVPSHFFLLMLEFVANFVGELKYL